MWNWCLEEGKLKKEDVLEVLENIINEQSVNYITFWDGLSLHQRLFLKAISKVQNKHTFSKEFIMENDLGTAGSVQKSIALLKKNIIKPNLFPLNIYDILFLKQSY